MLRLLNNFPVIMSMSIVNASNWFGQKASKRSLSYFQMRYRTRSSKSADERFLKS
nr:MAG TPA_asm: hypothetical protein [Caudoviricetes sp.]